jgi:hypothetical protein
LAAWSRSTGKNGGKIRIKILGTERSEYIDNLHK